VFDVRDGPTAVFSVHLPQPDKGLVPPLVQLTSSDASFLVYDPRQHPASIYSDGADRPKAPTEGEVLRCPKCGRTSFGVSVGFELPSDSTSPEDVSWTAVAAECAAGDWRAIVFDDETA